MLPTLADALHLVLPHLSPRLATPQVVSSLRSAACFLAPVPRAGFECRLQARAPRVDLQQNIVVSDDEPAMLAAHLAALMISAPAATVHPAWRHLRRFCLEWHDTASALHASVPEIWLELDLPDASAHTPVPAVFMGLQHDDLPGDEALASAVRALDILLGEPVTDTLRRGLARCFEAYAEGGMVSHVAIMWSRHTAALRVNVGRLRADRITTYLRHIGWAGRVDELDTLIAECFTLVDHMTVCLDVGTAVSPTIGLECFFQQTPDNEPRWRLFFDHLIERHLCTPEKRDALLAWPGVITPASAATPWPEHLICAALVQPSDRFSLFDRVLSHCKILYTAPFGLEAKAYFGFIHRWQQPAVAQAAAVTQPSTAVVKVGSRRAPQHAAASDRLAAAIAAATHFLLGVRSQGGWWLEYDDFEHGASDEWPTAYVGAMLASLPNEQARRAASWAWQLLARRHRPSGGWGWNMRIPLDADSIAWGLRLASGVGCGDSVQAITARHILAQHLLAHGGVVTYRAEHFYRASPRSEAMTRIRDWFDAHTCVTAAVAFLEEFAASCRRFLRQAQQAAGHWVGHWWCDDEYTTALAVEALAQSAELADQRAVRLAVRWAADRISPSGAVYSTPLGADSAFATACCVHILALTDNTYVRRQLERAVTWLIEQQTAEGSWEPSALLILRPREPQPAIILDQHSIFTTATVLKGLQLARAAGHCISQECNWSKT